MVVYIDVLVVVNFYITYLLLKSTAALLHTRLKTGRLIAASILGGISAVTAVFSLPIWLELPVRCALLVIPVLTAFGFSDARRLLLRTFTAYAISLLLCGTVTALRELTGNSFFAQIGGFVYLDVSVLTLIFSTTAAYLLISVFRRILDRTDVKKSYQLTIEKNGKSVQLTAFSDSGNNLRDFFTGLPVIVCRLSSVSELVPKDIEQFQGEPPSGVRLIPYTTIDGTGIIAAFRADEVTVDGKQVDALIGIGENAMKNEDFEAILNPKILI